MTNIKVSATIILPGRVLVAEKPISKKGKLTKEQKEQEKAEFNSTHEPFVVKLDNGKPLVVVVRRAKPASQNLHICQEAYDDMVTRPLKGFSEYGWKHLSANKRVKLHLIEIAQSMGGRLDSFEVMKD